MAPTKKGPGLAARPPITPLGVDADRLLLEDASHVQLLGVRHEKRDIFPVFFVDVRLLAVAAALAAAPTALRARSGAGSGAGPGAATVAVGLATQELDVVCDDVDLAPL